MRTEVIFHNYKIRIEGKIIGKKGEELKPFLSPRRGGKMDKRVRLYINGKAKNFTLSRLILEAFDGPMYGYEANHKDRDPLNCSFENLERTTASENQKHWRNIEKEKK